MSALDPLAVCGIGGAFIIALAGAFYKASNERSESYNRWHSRVNLSVSRLETKTLQELEALRAELERVLPDEFAPEAVSGNPSSLANQAQQAATTHKLGVRMRSDYKNLKRVGPALQLVIGVLLLATIGLTLDYSRIFDHGWIRSLGQMFGGVGIVALVLLGVGRAILLHRLGLSQERSGTTDSDYS